MHCHALSLIVHDSDVFFYDLFLHGEQLDGYNSAPQYFEKERLSDYAVESQRHKPDAFAPLLPPGVSLEELSALLNSGWWQAYDSGLLDGDGVPVDLDKGFVFEDDRMTKFGTLLRLHGERGEYPFAAWRNAQTIKWGDFVALRYAKQSVG